MVQAEGQNQESQASKYDIALHEEPEAEAELLQWSGALDFDDYSRYANAAVPLQRLAWQTTCCCLAMMSVDRGCLHGSAPSRWMRHNSTLPECRVCGCVEPLCFND